MKNIILYCLIIILICIKISISNNGFNSDYGEPNLELIPTFENVKSDSLWYKLFPTAHNKYLREDFIAKKEHIYCDNIGNKYQMYVLDSLHFNKKLYHKMIITDGTHVFFDHYVSMLESEIFFIDTCAEYFNERKILFEGKKPDDLTHLMCINLRSGYRFSFLDTIHVEKGIDFIRVFSYELSFTNYYIVAFFLNLNNVFIGFSIKNGDTINIVWLM
jgi:hypothetical protein